jgi:hypothetical protein
VGREANGMIDEQLHMKETQAWLHDENFPGNYGKGVNFTISFCKMKRESERLPHPIEKRKTQQGHARISIIDLSSRGGRTPLGCTT